MHIKAQAEIDIFISDEGYIVLRQPNGGGEPHVVKFLPMHGRRIAEAIDTLQAQHDAQAADWGVVHDA